jgi:hypothetical protein
MGSLDMIIGYNQEKMDNYITIRMGYRIIMVYHGSIMRYPKIG